MHMESSRWLEVHSHLDLVLACAYHELEDRLVAKRCLLLCGDQDVGSKQGILTVAGLLMALHSPPTSTRSSAICLLDELLRTCVHKQTKDCWPQIRVMIFNPRLRNRLLWAAAVLEQAISTTGYFAWDVTIASVQARCLSSEAGASSIDAGKVPNVVAASGNRFPVQYIDSAVSRGAIIQDKWFTRPHSFRYACGACSLVTAYNTVHGLTGAPLPSKNQRITPRGKLLRELAATAPLQEGFSVDVLPAFLTRDTSTHGQKTVSACATAAGSSPSWSTDPEAIAYAKCRGNALVYGRRGVVLAQNADGTYKVQMLGGKKKKKKKKKSDKSADKSELEVQERVQRHRLHWRFSLARPAEVDHVNAIIKKRQEVSASGSGFLGGLKTVPHPMVGGDSACVTSGGAWRPSPSEARVETTMRFFKRLRFKQKGDKEGEHTGRLAKLVLRNGAIGDLRLPADWPRAKKEDDSAPIATDGEHDTYLTYNTSAISNQAWLMAAVDRSPPADSAPADEALGMGLGMLAKFIELDTSSATAMDSLLQEIKQIIRTPGYCLLYHLDNHYCCIGGFRERMAATYPGVSGSTRRVTEFQYCAESQLPGGYSGLMWLTWYELVLSLVKFKKHTLMFVQKRST